MKILNKIYSYIYLLEFLCSIVFVVILMFFAREKNRIIRKIWAKIQLKFLGCKVQIQGEVDENAQLFVLNHQSVLDIVLLEYLHPKNPCWIAKQEITKLPIIGRIITIPKMISVDRNNPREIVHLLSLVKDRISENRTIMIFPEGTRSNGDKLLSFHPGAQIIANKLNLKVQPVVIVGSRKLLDTQTLNAHKGIAKVVFLPSFDAKGDWLENTRENMYKVLNENL